MPRRHAHVCSRRRDRSLIEYLEATARQSKSIERLTGTCVSVAGILIIKVALRVVR